MPTHLPIATYEFPAPVTAMQVLEKAADILAQSFEVGDAYTNPSNVKQFLGCKLAHYEREVFAVMFLDNQHQLIAFDELFQGTVDAASVYPREVVKAALKHNASAVIFSHNHPSGVAEPSQADRKITRRLVDALALIDVRVLDHIVIGKESVSFAERGWL
ncbi:DNA repair protein RadC [Vibrio sp. YMD68]|uniref:RadC family protein n=1 Tax=Vibrio sp. YMD68 TaxID=3042300 RepID=UPI00249B9611|nr:DNA repair protein RadC [Vibrio sp. YMD68]WGW00144.1 DNA repair protein RadC [Vibrio sp. YMD68]WGW00160.1 DNA repair protein RadC [Vibrio sp. YMD68]